MKIRPICDSCGHKFQHYIDTSPGSKGAFSCPECYSVFMYDVATKKDEGGMNRFFQPGKEKNHFPGFRVKLQKYMGPTIWHCRQCGTVEVDIEGQNISYRCVCGHWMEHQRWINPKDKLGVK